MDIKGLKLINFTKIIFFFVDKSYFCNVMQNFQNAHYNQNDVISTFFVNIYHYR
jgi:hypothetical protein